MTTKGNSDPYLQPRNQPTSNKDTLFLLEVGGNMSKMWEASSCNKRKTKPQVIPNRTYLS